MKKLTIFAAALLFSVAAFAQEEEDNSIVLSNYHQGESTYNLTYTNMYSDQYLTFVENESGYWEEVPATGYVFGHNNKKTKWVAEGFIAPSKMKFQSANAWVSKLTAASSESTVTFFLGAIENNDIVTKATAVYNISAMQTYLAEHDGILPIVFYEEDGQTIKEIELANGTVFMLGYMLDYTNPGDTIAIEHTYRSDDAAESYPSTIYLYDSYASQVFDEQTHEVIDTTLNYELVRWETAYTDAKRSASLAVWVYGEKLEDEEPDAIANVEAINVAVYPNPASEELRIENAENANIRIFNILGKEVYSTDRAANLERVNVKDFAKGTYFVRIEKEGKVASQKVLIAR